MTARLQQDTFWGKIDVNQEYGVEREMYAPTVSSDGETVMVTARKFIKAERRLTRTCFRILTIEEPEHR